MLSFFLSFSRTTMVIIKDRLYTHCYDCFIKDNSANYTDLGLNRDVPCGLDIGYCKFMDLFCHANIYLVNSTISPMMAGEQVLTLGYFISRVCQRVINTADPEFPHIK